MDTKAHASSSSPTPFPSSSRHASPVTTAGMATPKTARPRIPLGELPLSSFLSAANASASSPSSTTGVSPILKPVATRHFAASPTRVKRSTAMATSTPHTPPHHETHPVNVRPHHPHVATGLELGLDSPNHRPAALPASPTTCVAPATPPPSLLKRHQGPTSSSSPAAAHQATSSSSSASPLTGSNPTQSIPRRKRDRIDDATEQSLARERGQDPVWTSPSPHKNAAIAAAAAAAAGTAPPSSSRRYSSAHAHAHHHHRRMSSTGSTKAFALSPRFAAAKSLGPVAGGSALDDEEEDEDDDDDEAEEGKVAVKPLRINSPSTSTSMALPSSKSATPPRSGAAAPALGEDVFGVTTSSPSGGLVVFCDDEHTSVLPSAMGNHRADADRYAGEDGANRENDVSLLEKFLGSGRDDETATGVSKKNGKSKSKSPSLSMGSSSPGPSALSPMKRKKGTGGRLSLVATGEAGKDGQDGEEEDHDDDEAGEDEEASS